MSSARYKLAFIFHSKAELARVGYDDALKLESSSHSDAKLTLRTSMSYVIFNT